MLTCPSCSAENDPKAAFCQQCGARLADDTAQAEAAAADADFPVPPAPSDALEKFSQAAQSRQGDDLHEEHDVWNGCYSPKAMIGWWIAGGVVTLLALIAGLRYLQSHFGWLILGLLAGWAALAGCYAYRRYGLHYYLTTQRFIHETGILWRRTDRIELIDIDDVTFKQGPIERMFDVGTIHLSSSDRTDPEMDLPGIASVREVADQIDDLRRRERRRRGLHIEAV